jgi:hypothetical protein
MKSVTRGLRAFGHFWWDFLIGDAPELFAAVVAVVVLALLLRHHRQVDYIVIALATVFTLAASTLRAARRSGRKS